MVIIHQMAKVGSTAIQKALERAGIESLQTHNLGEHHLQNNLASFMSSFYTLERVKNELGLFKDQILATKLLEQSRLPGNPKQKLITLSRDPVIRWFSALVQNFNFLKPDVASFFEAQNGRKPANEFESFDYIISTVLELINQSDHMLGSNEFNEYFWQTRHAESERVNKILLLVGAELMVPFTWFQTNIQDLMDIDIYSQPITDGLLVTGNEHFELLYIKFENLRRDRIKTEQVLSEFLGSTVELQSENVSKGKEGFEALQLLEDKYAPLFMACPNIRDSKYCNHFHYPEHD